MFEKDITIDLYGTKQLSEVRTQYLLSSKICSSAVRSFGNKLYPAVQNIIHSDTGSFFSLADTSLFTDVLPERIKFFVAYEAISDILKNSYLANTAMEMANEMAADAVEDAHKMYQEWCNQTDFERKYPKILCMVFSKDNNKSQPPTKGFSTNYPLSQIEFKLIYADTTPEILVEALNSSSASYFTIILQDVTLVQDVFNTVNDIFNKYPDINWLTGIQTITTQGGFQINNQTTPSRRWNEHIFRRSLYGQTGRHIPSGATFFQTPPMEPCKR
ncbi:MAG: hypothetical protein IPN22_11310 [Bacteroidetes bacterium]|nr:hypothetical protein [Bacteroidota bacterium]